MSVSTSTATITRQEDILDATTGLWRRKWMYFLQLGDASGGYVRVAFYPKTAGPGEEALCFVIDEVLAAFSTNCQFVSLMAGNVSTGHWSEYPGASAGIPIYHSSDNQFGGGVYTIHEVGKKPFLPIILGFPLVALPAVNMTFNANAAVNYTMLLKFSLWKGDRKRARLVREAL